MSTATHFKYEIVRTFRNRIFYAVTLALPLVLFYAIATGQRSATQDGVSFPLYLNTFSAIRQVDPKLLETADVLGFSLWQRLRIIIAPSAAPQV